MNQHLSYETATRTNSDPTTIYADPAIYADPNPTVAATANVLNQIAFTFRVDELINRRITSARAKRRVFGSADHS